MSDSSKKEYYGKRPLWHWVVIYLIIGAVVYGAIYYFFLSKKGGYTNSVDNTQGSSQYNYSK